MLQQIRNKMGMFIAVFIGLALFAFILGDCAGNGGSFMRAKYYEIGEVAGNTLTLQEYEAGINEISEIYKMNSNSASLDEATVDQIRLQAWNQMVQKYTMSEVYDELSIEVTSVEMLDLVQGENPHPIIRQLFTDQNTGQFNRAAVINFIKSVDASGNDQQIAYWNFLQREIESSRKTEKYNQMASKGLYVTSADAEMDAKRGAQLYDIDYIVKNYRDVSDSTVTVTDSEIRSYFNAHADEYEQRNSRTVSYVTFPVVASEDDIQETKEWISDLKNDFRDTKDVTSFVNLNSDIKYAPKYITEASVPAKLKAFAFDAKEGDVSDVYRDGNSWSIAKVVDYKLIPDSVEARHILIRVNSQEEYASATLLADSLKSGIESGKIKFAQAAKDNSADPGSAQKGGDLGWFKQGMMVQQFNDAAFSGKVGEVQIVATQFGLHILEVQKESDASNNVNLAVITRTIEASSETYQKRYREASRFAAENTTLEAFDATVEAESLTKRGLTLYEITKDIAGLENSRAVIRAAFNNGEVGQIVVDNSGNSVFELENNFMVAVVKGVQEKGPSTVEDVQGPIKMLLVKQKKAEALMAQFSGDMATVAKSNGLTIKKAEGIKFDAYSIPGGIGVEPAVIGVASSLEVGSVSKPIEGKNGVFVIKVTAKAGGEVVDIDMAKTRLTAANKQRAAYSVQSTLTENANVEDNRVKFY